ncbi:roadblock/LC7 domain-containing protein [Verrucosispora sp. WMMA2044]|uniref:Roadblock/LC7 domain-containing protein n=1 Tax=Verrucosispora sioxanthis TaxID=2499994 RepID=A0A6M1L9T0_9ACTN|nr:MULTISPECIES: roadblock/LC7 domain-containing protein [Micromonospora]MCZ7423285.1 roadblock/LC7 domain-containing protein [Verrucosispora sp. WMMA2121]NEE65938.1 roadblock/LC7 domain-containing protein [Verrucosispora sioxanthis]NGM15048.1 roadblock/LC7 domain-containing protein [Verrucosispora sioxanthis]WBB50596.1 roadblock/LC7 domain-containing protein [Verrucosispora sp. WMMA2044]
MTSAVATADNLGRALDNIVDRVPGAQFAVVLSPDGLLLGASRGIDDELAGQLSSMVCGLQALGLAAARVCGDGELHQVVVQMSRAFLFHATTGNGAVLAVGIDGDAEVGDMAYEVAMFVAQAGDHLPVYLEPVAQRVALH